jgi:hypothetical protein
MAGYISWQLTIPDVPTIHVHFFDYRIILDITMYLVQDSYVGSIRFQLLEKVLPYRPLGTDTQLTICDGDLNPRENRVINMAHAICSLFFKYCQLV